jgi:predicted O-linked N-acetylglucosamine transferase (SPINDLY family)
MQEIEQHKTTRTHSEAAASELHLLGVLATQSGDAHGALDLIGRAIQIDPCQAPFHSNLGNALMGIGRHEDAIACFNRAVELRPNYVIALINRGICLIHLGRCAPAVESLSAAIDAHPHSPEALINRGVALAKLARHEEAIADYDRAIALRPGYADAEFNRAVALRQLSRAEDALAGYGRVLSLRPGHVEALIGRASVLLQLKRFEESLASFDQALQLAPHTAALHNDRGLVLQCLRRLEESLRSFDRALALQPGFLKALNNRGWILRQLGRPKEAMAALDQALALKADFVEALTNYGAVYKDLERSAEALNCLDAALRIDPDFPDALGNRGVILLKQRRYAEAIECFRRLLDLDPEAEYALGNIFNSLQRCCDWGEYPVIARRISEGIACRRQVIDPFCYLAVADDPASQLGCARLFADRHLILDASDSPCRRRAARDRIRLAYVSGDFRDHAVAYLTAGLFEAHDRGQFDLVAVSLQPRQDSAMGARLEASFDQFLDVSGWSDKDIIGRLRELEVDIAVDLAGWTGANRTGVFVGRAAPLQVNYLGFPGTMGLSSMDYLIADEFVIPVGSRQHYAEQVVYLPHCFQANDGRRKMSPSPVSRLDCGLPEHGFVFCSFNNSYKINPPFFDVWARLLAAVPGSVLWLVGDNELAENNLRRETVNRGIGADRLVFARRLPYEDHLRRLSLADLFLDSLPFNAGTTGSDALWAGVPVLTCPGSSFAARMCGSLLRAVGLPELIVDNLHDYETLALRVATERGMSSGLRAKLAANRNTYPLFDTAGFCRHIESAYRGMWERLQRGEPPAAFSVNP